jgi:MtaA/CmuA family methyltransferase
LNGKERCLQVLNGSTPDKIPFFPLMMFMAADRAKMQFREYATNGPSLAEAQINLFENYRVDAVTVSSDAFRVAADLGGNMAYPENQTPYAASPLIKDEESLRSLVRPNPDAKGSRMRDRLDAVSQLARTIGERAMVFGWVEMPFAEACNLCGLANFMMLIVDEPEFAHEILEFVTKIEIDFADAQLEVGACAIGCGDAAASMISKAQFQEFALPYERRVTDAIRKSGGYSKLHICGNSSHILGDLATNGADIFNVDHMVDLQKAGEAYFAQGHTVKGNVNPVTDLLSATPEHAFNAAAACVKASRGKKFILGAGCEIPAATPDEVYFAFADAVSL